MAVPYNPILVNGNNALGANNIDLRTGMPEVVSLIGGSPNVNTIDLRSPLSSSVSIAPSDVPVTVGMPETPTATDYEAMIADLQGQLDAVQASADQAPSMFDTSLDYMKTSAEGTKTLAGYTPETVTAGTLPGVDISQYMDPYTQEVIDTSLADLERQRLIQQQGIGAQAQAAGAFGGSRMGIQEAMTNEAFARQAGTLAAGLRSAGFTQAQNLAQQDLARQMQAGIANQGAGLQGAQFQLGAYNQLGGMGLTGYNLANEQLNQFMANEAMKQGLQTNLYGQEVGQATGFFGQPVQSLPYVSAALGASPMPQTTTQAYSPGVFDYLTLATTGYGLSRR